MVQIGPVVLGGGGVIGHAAPIKQGGAPPQQVDAPVLFLMGE